MSSNCGQLLNSIPRSTSVFCSHYSSGPDGVKPKIKLQEQPILMPSISENLLRDKQKTEQIFTVLPNHGPNMLSRKDKLKQAVKDYGMIVIGFHITISLMSLGVCYLLVSSGIDVVELLRKIGIEGRFLEGGMAAGASTFVIAYAIHKVFAPGRIAVTLASAPVIVNRLRKLGILRQVKSNASKCAK